MAKPKRAALYVRVSTDAQTVENQISELRDVAERRGWQVVEIYKATANLATPNTSEACQIGKCPDLSHQSTGCYCHSEIAAGANLTTSPSGYCKRRTSAKSSPREPKRADGVRGPRHLHLGAAGRAVSDAKALAGDHLDCAIAGIKSELHSPVRCPQVWHRPLL